MLTFEHFSLDGGATPDEVRTYQQLDTHSNRLAAWLMQRGIKKGDRVLIYIAMSVEGIVAMQACARIGAIHSVVFGGFSAKSLEDRIEDAGAKLVITSDGQCRGGKAMPLKHAVDEARTLVVCDSIQIFVVYNRSGGAVDLIAQRDVWWHDVVAGQADTCEPV